MDHHPNQNPNLKGAVVSSSVLFWLPFYTTAKGDHQRLGSSGYRCNVEDLWKGRLRLLALSLALEPSMQKELGEVRWRLLPCIFFVMILSIIVSLITRRIEMPLESLREG